MRLSGFKPYAVSLVSFGYNFKLKAEEGLPCPYCGVTMSTIEEINKFVDDMNGATGNKIIAGIEKFEDRLPEVERSVTNRLKIEAEEHNQISSSVLLNQIQHKPKKELERTQKEILNGMQEIANELTDDTYQTIL